MWTKNCKILLDENHTNCFIFLSWFAGYMSEEEAKKKLQSEKRGAFLVRFKCYGQPGFLLTKKSRNGLSIVDFPIEVSNIENVRLSSC